MIDYTFLFIRNWFIRNSYKAGQKDQETLVLYSRTIKKLYNINLSKKEYICMLPLVNLYDFCLEKIVTCDFGLLEQFS